MDRSDVIKLITQTRSKNTLGVYETTLAYKQVYCNVSSVSQSEFFDGGRSGLKPAFRMSLFFGDYNGEEMLEYKGQTYSIYRTYLRGTDIIELYVERKGGSNGKQESDA